MKRTRHTVRYHNRPGRPQIHTAKSGRRYIMVRAEGGGTKRLYEGSKYWSHKDGGKTSWKTLYLG